jgi:hypothetical protein
MAWGKSKQSAAPSTFRSAHFLMLRLTWPYPAFANCCSSQLLPLVILLLFLGGVAFVGYQIYVSVTKIQQSASQKMGNKNVVFTKDGVRVGVKHVETERYVDATQSWVVKAWNLHNSSDQPTEVNKNK